MNRLTVLFLIITSNLVFGQESPIQSKILSVFCDKDSDAYRLNTILTKDSTLDGTRIVHFSTSATCCVDFRIKSTLVENTVKMELEEDGVECECFCAYDFGVQFNAVFDSKTKFFVNRRELRTDVPKVRPYEKRYFVYENDTTGFDDENGLRQGHMVFKRKNDLKKI